MVRSRRVDDPVVGPRAGPSLCVFLQPTLRALEEEARRIVRQLRARQRRQPGPRDLPAEVEVDGPGDRLEGRGEQRRASPAAALGLALAEHEQRSEIDPVGEARQAGRADDRGAARREKALVIGRVGGEQGVGDREVDDDVAEELEALVVAARRVAVLVEPAAVDECLLEKVEVADGKAEALRECGCRAHRSRRRSRRRLR